MIKRMPRRETWTPIPNTIINDTDLDWRDLGLLCYLLSKPDNWEVNVNHLAKQRKTGRDGIYGILGRLREKGYVSFTKHADGTTDWLVSECPEPDTGNPDMATEPDTGKPDQAHPDLGNPDVIVMTDHAVKTDKQVMTECREAVIAHLNLKTGAKFSPTSKAAKLHIDARFKEGYTAGDMMDVIDSKCAEWLEDQKMYKFLRPETLFCSKFESYLATSRMARPQSPETGFEMLMRSTRNEEDEPRRMPSNDFGAVTFDQRSVGVKSIPFTG
jgi:uncharacterized phage protein (TIGR02220 family)